MELSSFSFSGRYRYLCQEILLKIIKKEIPNLTFFLSRLDPSKPIFIIYVEVCLPLLSYK